MQFYAENEKKYSSQALKMQSEHRSARKISFIISPLYFAVGASAPVLRLRSDGRMYTLRQGVIQLILFAIG